MTSLEPNQSKNTHKSNSNSYTSKDTTAFDDRLSDRTTSLQTEMEESENFNQEDLEQIPRSRQRGLGLRAKAIGLAIALGTLPVLGIGATTYYLANQSLVNQIKQSQETRSVELADRVNSFMAERYGDIQVMANLPILSNPKLRAATTSQQKQAALNRFLDAYLIYDSIAVADLTGKTIAQSIGEPVTGLGERDYFKEVLRTDSPVITPPRKSELTGKYSIFLAAPIEDTATGKTIAVVRSRIPVNRLEEVIARFEGQSKDEEYHVIDSEGKFFLAKEKNQVGRDARTDFPGLAQRDAAAKVDTWVTVDRIDNAEQVISFAPFEKIPGSPQIDWSVIIASDTAIAFAPQRQLLLALLLGTSLTALVVGAIAAYLGNRATRPILAATNAVEKLGQGDFDTRVAVSGEDELATLGSNINQMASQLQDLLQKQAAETKRTQLFADIAASRARGSQDLDPVFNIAVQGAREILKADRVVVYRFQPDWSGYISAESVIPGWPQALADKIDDPCIGQELIEAYKKGRVVPTNNVFETNYSPEHMKLLERLQVKANLVTPIVSNDQLFGLLVAHYCDRPHVWQQSEINFLTQLAAQVGLALDRVSFLEQQTAAKEKLQQRALELLLEVDPVSKGDLTIRASVTEDEIGTIADSYNATINSLRKIVTQVQAAAQQVAATTSSNEVSVQELSAEALRQTEEITAALDRIQEVSNSMRAVARSAEQAEVAVQQATQTVAAGDAAMNRTVEGFLAIRETVTETAEKVKRLGEASQQISKVVKLIDSFADQTNLLALNAALEAARAGEQGRGFAVVADEVQALALQSAAATAEIDKLVTAIQAETNEVVAAMEAGTEQVVSGTKLVDETRQSLNQITAVSAQIGDLVQAIASAAVAQSQASESVTQTMSDVAAIASKNSTEATVVSASFQELQAVAQELQASARQFKVS